MRASWTEAIPESAWDGIAAWLAPRLRWKVPPCRKSRQKSYPRIRPCPGLIIDRAPLILLQLCLTPRGGGWQRGGAAWVSDPPRSRLARALAPDLPGHRPSVLSPPPLHPPPHT